VHNTSSKEADETATVTAVADAELVASHAMQIHFDATFTFSWNDRNHVLRICVESLDTEVYHGTFALCQGQLVHDAHVHFPFFHLPAPVMDAKLEQALAQITDAIVGHDSLRSTLLALPDARADDLWTVLRVAPGLFGTFPNVTIVGMHEEENGDVIVVVVDVAVFSWMRLCVRATLVFTYDDGTRTVDVSTRSCTWGTFKASVHVRTSDDHRCLVSFGACFVPVLPLSYVFSTATLDFTPQLERELLRAADVKRTKAHAFLDAFEPLVLQPLLHSASMATALRFKDVATHLERMMRHTCTGGKSYRALLLRTTVSVLGGAVGERLLHGVGWALEAMQAAALVWDDIMDHSETRRGKPCWYRVVGNAHAINDGVMLYSIAYRLLEHHLRDRPRTLQKALRETVDTVMQSCLGQHIDVVSENDMDVVSEERYGAIVQCKTAMYTFYHPLALAILLCDREGESELLQNASVLTVTLGRLFQEADDYLDLYGDPARTGKGVGTDVKDGKLTWMIAHALANADAAQAEELRVLYGSDGGVARVSEIFDALGIQEEYERRQRTMRNTCLRDACVLLKPIVHIVIAELTRRQA
tara:strand:+ start:1847 stop:3607 length:1761 start_codon:yes stop_codon:yes gene_type:complete